MFGSSYSSITKSASSKAGSRLRVKWTIQARNDLASIHDYIFDAGSPKAAHDYATRIERYVERIGDSPRAVRVRSEIRPGVRLRPFESVVIAYVIEESVVKVLRVLHHSRDYSRLLR